MKNYDSFFSRFVDCAGLGIVGTAPGNAGCLQKIKDLVMLKSSASPYTYLGYPDSVAAYMEFPDWTRFLGGSYFSHCQPSTNTSCQL